MATQFQPNGAGSPTTCEFGLYFASTSIEYRDFRRPRRGEFLAIAPYDPNMKARVLSGPIFARWTEKEAILAWFYSENAGSATSILIPDTENAPSDQWVGNLVKVEVSQAGPDLYQVDIVFEEVPVARE